MLLRSRIRRRTVQGPVRPKRVKLCIPKRICGAMLLYEVSEKLPVCLTRIVADFLETTESLLSQIERDIPDSGREWRWMARSISDWSQVICVAPHLAALAPPDSLSTVLIGFCDGGHLEELVKFFPESRPSSWMCRGFAAAISHGRTCIVEFFRSHFEPLTFFNHLGFPFFPLFCGELQDALKYGHWSVLRELRLHWGLSAKDLPVDYLSWIVGPSSSLEMLSEMHEGFRLDLASLIFGSEPVVVPYLLEAQRRWSLGSNHLDCNIFKLVQDPSDIDLILVAFQVDRADATYWLACPLSHGAAVLRHRFQLTAEDARYAGALQAAIGWGLTDDDCRALPRGYSARARALCPDLVWPERGR